jgi:hypothetical protein
MQHNNVIANTYLTAKCINGKIRNIKAGQGIRRKKKDFSKTVNFAKKNTVILD